MYTIVFPIDYPDCTDAVDIFSFHQRISEYIHSSIVVLYKTGINEHGQTVRQTEKDKDKKFEPWI